MGFEGVMPEVRASGVPRDLARDACSSGRVDKVCVREVCTHASVRTPQDASVIVEGALRRRRGRAAWHEAWHTGCFVIGPV
jgi:hypothetical protein